MKKSKSFLCIMLVILMVCSLFAGCAKADDAAEQPDQNGDAADIPADGGEKPAFDKLEISMFNGGYGDLWIEMIALFQEYYPGVEVVSDLSADNATRVRARMLTNDPPDVVVVSGPDFNPFEAAQSGLYRPLTDLFRNGRTADGRNYADIINPSILNEGTVQDEVYLPPFGATYIGWWYDQTLFDARDWTVPESWDAFTDLSADIAAAGISPFVYAGIYPNYLINGYLYAAVAAAGGYEAYEDAFINLKEGAWSSDAVRTAITDLYDLVKNGYMYSGVTGIDHTQSQMEYLNGRAAFLPCGSWLETEMKDSISDGFQMTFTPPPMADADGNHYLTTYSGLVGIPAKAKNPEAAEAFLGVMYSVEGQKLIAKYASVPVVTDVSAEELSEYLTPTMLSVMEAASRGDIKFVSGNPEMWYADLYVALRENLTNIVLNDITPDEFCANMEAAAKGVREDDSVAKYYTE